MLLDVSCSGLYPNHPAQGSAEPSTLLLLPRAMLLWRCSGCLCLEPPLLCLGADHPTSFSSRAVLPHPSLNSVLAQSLPNWCRRGVSGLLRPRRWPEHLGVGRGCSPSTLWVVLLPGDPSLGAAVTLELSSPRSFAPGAADPQQPRPQHLSASLLESSSCGQHWLRSHPLGNQVPGACQEHNCGEQLDECHL